ncbi:hypothetical protein ANI_1_1946024 [Paecilomyces variotii No. 5]|uniref:Transcription factor Iwr1 domain-containing protein n=1 Tax=Byssochlamys spectabilis (strain No. 5 / NBRC 109023) TaxID=1356009 RepID=V5HXX6_BYSSN|nr:hypothetical protein ANI_1_1946024 [Paecilomyces variotii No. 5]
MALPPEHINIKRRREEEPVETLYIQSDLHQTKRRFTDFVFQRVRITGDASQVPIGPPQEKMSPARRGIRSPRSVSNIQFPPISNGARGTLGGGGIPLVRATSPGAELREQKRLAEAEKQAQDQVREALNSTPAHESAVSAEVSRPATPAGAVSSAPSAGTSPHSLHRRTSSLRKFHISRPATPASPLRAGHAGVQKRPSRAILVEKLARKPEPKRTAMLETIARTGDAVGDSNILEGPTVTDEGAAPTRRKRPVVNQAERLWREQQKSAISAAKKHITDNFDKDVHTPPDIDIDNESEELARQFNQIARDLETQMETQPSGPKEVPTPAPRSVLPKPALKYQPRSPNKPRQGAPAVESTLKTTEQDKARDSTKSDAHQEGEDSDGDYVYDVYVRRPLPAKGALTDPLLDLDATRKDIGVVVISQEDEEYWEPFVVDEDEEEQWDSEDADSNAEDNPANDYPDEELSSGDEYDNPSAIYSRYRNRANSDDEGYDMEDYDSEGELVARFGQRFHHGLDSENEDDW